MIEPRSATFREQTTGRISDLLFDEGLQCAHSMDLLSYLAGALLSYKEEGVEFAPVILMCGSIQKFLESFPGAVSHSIGRVALSASSGAQILKDCAPLSSRNWFMFIERTNDLLAVYGVFTYFRLPTAIPLHEGITINPDQFCILVRKVSLNTIEMRGAKGSLLTLIFSTTRAAINAGSPISEFAMACCSNALVDGIGKDFKSYFVRLLEAALTSSHGTILVCGDGLDLAKMPEMQDSVIMNPMLDFQTAFAEYQTANSAEAILNLQRCEELLSGFLRCDGIVVFDTSSRVTAYRVFFRQVASATDKPANVVGGARRRAYEEMKRLVGSRVVSVLFRSQDGLTLHCGAE